MKKKRLGLILVSCLLITSLFLSGTAYAQDEELPDPGITPDSPFYFIDRWGKNIGMFFTFGPEAKAKKALEYAEERLSEFRVMADKKKVREMTRAANDYNGYMVMINERTEEARQQGISDNISERVALVVSKHLSVLDMVSDIAPEGAEGAIIRVREASMNGQINALRALGNQKPEAAIDISSSAIESRLNRVRVKAAANATAEVEESLNYIARLAEIEEEMAAIAEEQGIDISAIQRRLAQSTDNRLEVLAGVYEKVPETARPAIENAIENSVRMYERAVEKLKEEDALGETPEEAPALERVQAEVKEKLKIRTSTEAQASDNVAVKVRVRTENEEGVQEKVREQTANTTLKTPKTPETPEMVTSANMTENITEATPPQKPKSRNP
jgi:hypothetical protein